MKMSIDELLLAHGVGNAAGGASGKFITIKGRTVIPAATSVVAINAPKFDAIKDSLLVFQNSTLLQENVDYRLSADRIKIENLSSTWNTGTVFDFLAIRNVRDDIPYQDGGLITNGTIQESALSQEIRDKLDTSEFYMNLNEDIAQLQKRSRQLNQSAANAALVLEANNVVVEGSTFGTNGDYTFTMIPDFAATLSTATLPVGTTVLTGKVSDANAFTLGQEITICDDVNFEHVKITRREVIGATAHLEITPTQYAYKTGSRVARSTVSFATTEPFIRPWTFGATSLKKHVLRFKLPSTEEVIAWVTAEETITSTLAISYDNEATYKGMSKELTTPQYQVNITGIATGQLVGMTRFEYVDFPTLQFSVENPPELVTGMTITVGGVTKFQTNTVTSNRFNVPLVNTWFRTNQTEACQIIITGASGTLQTISFNVLLKANRIVTSQFFNENTTAAEAYGRVEFARATGSTAGVISKIIGGLG